MEEQKKNAYLETSGAQNSSLFLSLANFFNTSLY
jgi:hypothetical protein